jgi:hemerythrin superfamily protein
MPDAFEVLGAAHREVEWLLERLQAMIGGAAEASAELREQGGSLAGALISAVSLHEAAEEEYFWPAVTEKVADGEWLAAGGVEQETEARKVLAELDGMAPGDPRFILLMTQFNRAARAHVAYEEQRVWPGLRAVLSADEAGQLGEKLARAAKAAPAASAARPGPAESSGPGRAAAGKLRDARHQGAATRPGTAQRSAVLRWK